MVMLKYASVPLGILKATHLVNELGTSMLLEALSMQLDVQFKHTRSLNEWWVTGSSESKGTTTFNGRNLEVFSKVLGFDQNVVVLIGDIKKLAQKLDFIRIQANKLTNFRSYLKL